MPTVSQSGRGDSTCNCAGDGTDDGACNGAAVTDYEDDDNGVERVGDVGGWRLDINPDNDSISINAAVAETIPPHTK